MKIAVLADIHANHLALEACMKRIDELGADEIVFLGDYTTDCPYPRKTMELLYKAQEEYRCRFVRGNREDYLLSHKNSYSDGWRYCSQSGSLLYTFEELTGRDLRFFESMPISEVVSIEGYPSFSICHGSMSDNRRHFGSSSRDIAEVIREQGTELMLCGHSHECYTYSHEGRRIINPGTLLAPQANMLMIESDGGDWQAEHLSIPYDVEQAIAEFKESGLLEKADAWARAVIAILEGRGDMPFAMVGIVRKSSAERSLPFDTEVLWQEAAEELGI